MRAAGPDSKLRQTLYGAPDSAEIGGDAGMFTTSFQPWAALRGIAPHETGVIRTRHPGGATRAPTAPPAQQEGRGVKRLRPLPTSADRRWPRPPATRPASFP